MYLGRRCILSGTIIDLSMEAFDIICSILEYAPDAAAAAFQEGGAEAMNAKDLGRRLRSAREARGLSQQAVAHALSLPRTAVTQLEAGSRSVSTLELTRLSELYLHPVADLLHEGPRDEDRDVLVALHRVAPGLEEDPVTREQVARCVHLCREGVSLERLLDAEPRSGPPSYEMRLPRSPGEAVAQGEEAAEQERRRLGIADAPIADVSELIASQGVWASGVTLPDGMSGLLLAAATALLPNLEAGRALDAKTLREAMSAAFGASDTQGAWVWKDAYEAAEAAMVLFIQRYGRLMRREAGAGPGSAAAMLAMLETLAALEPSQTRRSEEQLALQQFSTPLPLAYAALQAAAIRPGDIVLEPSAGTGMLAVMAECALGKRTDDARSGDPLHLNEIAAVRAGLLSGLFAHAPVTRHNAESIADYLPGLRPTVVLMNPPFSASPGVQRIRHDADLRHLRSAFSMLPAGGRLVAITSAGCIPGDAAWRVEPRALPAGFDEEGWTVFRVSLTEGGVAFEELADLAHRAERVLDDVGAGERAPEFVRQAEADDGEDLVQPLQDAARDARFDTATPSVRR